MEIDDLLVPGGAIDLFARLIDAPADPAQHLIGKQLGGYRLTSLLGQGGMGLVFRAERIDGRFDREVAIKISAGSGISQGLRERFLQEQSILAGLNHPNIAQLYDADHTAEGWPYFVLELVEGETIDAHCRRTRANTDQIVDIMLEVADAVAYAHARLVVHRDIKPSNLLVTRDGRPKLLDFGIARLFQADQAQVTNDRALSLRYASPEQLLGQPVTVASDLYQLGLVLGELLAGEPLRPNEDLASAMAGASRDDDLTIQGTIRARLPQDLVLMVEQCLRSSPKLRYPDVGSFQLDLQRYRKRFPVAAAGRNPTYRMRKFIGRNSLPVSVTAVAAIGLATVSIWYLMAVSDARERAELEADTANQVTRFLIDTFQSANPEVTERTDLSMREGLDHAAARIEQELVTQPHIRARMHEAVARAYWRLGEIEPGLEHIERAAAMSKALYPRLHEQILRIRQVHVSLLIGAARYDAAETLARLQIDEAAEAHGPTAVETLKARNNLATLLDDVGRIDEALELHRSVYQDKQRILGASDPSTLLSAGNLVKTLSRAGNVEESVQLGTTILPVAREVLGSTNSRVLALTNNLAISYYHEGRYAEAHERWGEHLERTLEVFGADALATARSRSNVAIGLVALGRLEEAETMQRRVAEAQSELLGLRHPVTLRTLANHADTLARIGRTEESLAQFDATIAAQTELFGATHYNTLHSRAMRADALLTSNHPNAAKQFEAVLRDVHDTLGADHFLAAELEKMRESGALP